MSEPTSRFGDSLTQFSRELNEFTLAVNACVGKPMWRRAIDALVPACLRRRSESIPLDVLRSVVRAELAEIRARQSRPVANPRAEGASE